MPVPRVDVAYLMDLCFSNGPRLEAGLVQNADTASRRGSNFLGHLELYHFISTGYIHVILPHPTDNLHCTKSIHSAHQLSSSCKVTSISALQYLT